MSLKLGQFGKRTRNFLESFETEQVKNQEILHSLKAKWNI
jgi:ferritin